MACTTATSVTVDSEGDVGLETSIAWGSDLLPVIAHFDFTRVALRVTKCLTADCSESSTTAVDTGRQSGKLPSVTIGTNGFPMIAHLDFVNSRVWVTNCDDHACTTSTTTYVDDVASSDVSMTVGLDRHPIVASYASGDVDLRLVRCNNFTCTDE